LDYEQLPFKCNGCDACGHFNRNCLKKITPELLKEEVFKLVPKRKRKKLALVPQPINQEKLNVNPN
jgi:hypothetical protein